MDWYRLAKIRVEADDELATFADIILDDWPEGDEHWQWVTGADKYQIIDWALAIDEQDPETAASYRTLNG